MLVSTQSGSVIQWTGLTGDAAGTRGYQILYRFVAGGSNSILGLRFNGDTAANYSYVVENTQTGGAPVNSASSTSASSVQFNALSQIGTNEIMSGLIWIPVSVSGFARFVHGQASQFSSATIRKFDVAGRWSNTASQITQIDLIAAGGSVGSNTTATLYRVTK